MASALIVALRPSVSAGAVHARGMALHVGHFALKHACPIKHSRAQPGAMCARPHDSRVALMPGAFEEGPGPANTKVCPRSFSSVTLHAAIVRPRGPRRQ